MREFKENNFKNSLFYSFIQAIVPPFAIIRSLCIFSKYIFNFASVEDAIFMGNLKVRTVQEVQNGNNFVLPKP